MPATVEILTVPLGSQLVRTIGNNDSEDLNDFPVLLLFSENVNLTESGLTVSAGATLVSLEGANSVWMAKVRPPQTAGTVTVTVVANAVSQGNPQTSKDIAVVTDYPDTNAETPTLAFAHGTNARGLAVSPTRILLNGSSSGGQAHIHAFTHAGIEQTSEQLDRTLYGLGSRRIDYFNGSLLVQGNQFYRASGRFSLTDLSEIENYGLNRTLGYIVHTRLGILSISGTEFHIQPYGTTEQSDVITKDLPSGFPGYHTCSHQDNLLYLANRGFLTNHFGLAEIDSDDNIRFIRQLNINDTGIHDTALYRDTLYLLKNNGVYTLDIRKYRPIAKNTKTTIYPIFANEGDTIDLNQFAPDAERIVFDVGYDLQPNLSINASNGLVVGSGAQTCLVKLKAINRIGATEPDSFQFYLIVRRAAAPVWRGVSELTMKAGSSYDLFQLVPDAESISFRSGRARLTDSSLSNGMFTIGTVGGVAEFTARIGSRSSHIAITIDVVQGMGSESPGVSGYRIEIAGIDVTSDSVELPSVSETLDPVVINEYRVNEASITLRNNGGKYNSDLAGNFWETNGLNPGGFQNAVKIYLEHTDGSESLHFSGVINESFAPIKDATFKLNCSDISSRLRKALVQAFGTLEKWDALRKQSDEDSYEGVYVPEQSLVPMQVGTGKARSDRTDLEISRLELPSEGPIAENTGYMTPTEFRTAGGFLEENPLLGFMAEHRSEDVRFLMNQLAINKEVYNTEIDIPGVEVKDPFLAESREYRF